MVHQKYREQLDKYIKLDNNVWEQLKAKLTIKDYKKGDILHSAGTINTNFYFINHGLIRAYIIDHNGNDITWDFHFNDDTAQFYNTFIVDAATFPTQDISRITFELLEDSQIVSLNHQNLQVAYAYLEGIEKLSRLLAEQNGAYFQNRIMDRYTKNATQRYTEYINKYPNISSKVKQSYIASYLGIKPESLSRIKNHLKITNNLLVTKG
jgi:CRP-like cAMP-binding protein